MLSMDVEHHNYMFQTTCLSARSDISIEQSQGFQTELFNWLLMRNKCRDKNRSFPFCR